MTEYKNVGALTDLGDGSIMEPGAVRDVDDTDPFNQALIQEGHLVPTEEPKATKKGGDK